MAFGPYDNDPALRGLSNELPYVSPDPACNLLCFAIAVCSLLRSTCSSLCFAIAACSQLRSACN